MMQWQKMMKMVSLRWKWLVLGAVAFVVATGTFWADDKAERKQSLIRGAKLYKKDCQSCHGPKGKGNTPMGQMLGNLGDMSDTAMNQLSDEKVLDLIINNNAPMPTYEHYSEQDRKDILRFVRYLARERK